MIYNAINMPSVCPGLDANNNSSDYNVKLNMSAEQGELCQFPVFLILHLFVFITSIRLTLKPMDSFGMWWKSNEIIVLYWVIIVLFYMNC